MTLKYARLDGSLSPSKVLRRFKTVLNLTYLQADSLPDGSYRIPATVFNQIQTELDFNLPDETQKQKLEDQIKKRYRQRNTYRFWKEFLDIANITSRDDAKEYLMKIYHKLDNKGVYGSMTHSYYALETLHLALDDAYNTNEVILHQYQVTNPTKPNKRRGAKKKSSKKKSANKQTVSTPAHPDPMPF